MTNLTIAVDADILRRARIRALDEGSSVNALLRDFLSEYVSEDRQARDRAALRRLVEHAASHPGDSGGVKLSRDDAYEERLRWPR